MFALRSVGFTQEDQSVFLLLEVGTWSEGTSTHEHSPAVECAEKGIEWVTRVAHAVAHPSRSHIMGYLLTVTILVTGSVLLGVRWGKRAACWCDTHPTPSAAVLIGSTLTWLVLSYFARIYAEGDGVGWGVAEWFAHRGKWYIFTCFALLCISMLTHATLLVRMDGEYIDFIDPAYGYQQVPVGRFEQIWYGKTTVFRVKEGE